MSETKPLGVQEKKELVSKGEKTTPGRYYLPPTDIYETANALIIAMELPGVARESIEVKIEDDVLYLDARIDYAKYEGMEPLYTEYNVGHFTRSFALSQGIDQQQISAAVTDGVLTLTLLKAKQVQPRRIAIQ